MSNPHQLGLDLCKALQLPPHVRHITLDIGLNALPSLQCVHLVMSDETPKVVEQIARYELLPVGERNELLALLARAEAFIAGFEDDQAQEGIPELLADIRAALPRSNA
jgi:hypothetical protein